MLKQWYFQVMGAEIGPISSAELKEKVKRGQIQPETLVRVGTDGKWQPAARVKGLLDPPAPRPSPPAPTSDADRPPTTPARVSSATTPAAVSGRVTISEERTYHLAGQALSDASSSSTTPESREYEFFEFVGFDLAIGHALHQVLLDHCHQHQQTITQVTRRAIAAFLGRKDLAEDVPASDPGSPTAEVAEVGTGSSPTM
jgi:hypothetical protein